MNKFTKMTFLVCMIAMIGSRAYSQQSDLSGYKVSPEEIQRMHDAIKKLNELKKNMATKKQRDELKKKLKPLDDDIDESGLEAGNLVADTSKLDYKKGFPRKYIDKAIKIHKKLRSEYKKEISVYLSWGMKYGREGCVKEAEKAESYYISASNMWLKTLPSLPLGDEMQRIEASSYLAGGEKLGVGLINSKDWNPNFEVRSRLHNICISGG